MFVNHHPYGQGFIGQVVGLEVTFRKNTLPHTNKKPDNNAYPVLKAFTTSLGFNLHHHRFVL